MVRVRLKESIGRIQRTGDKAYVLAVNSQNQVERREIQTGIQGSDKVEVLSGLKPAEQILISSYETLGDADRIVLTH